MVRLRLCLRALLLIATWSLSGLSLEAQSIFTIAGGGTDDGRPATLASLFYPADLAFDNGGNLYVADSEHHRIRRVDAVTGIITTVAGNGTGAFSGDGGPATQASLNQPWGVAVDGSGNLYIADASNDRIRRVDGGTGIITTIIEMGSPVDVAIGLESNVYISDSGHIRRLDPETGIITTVAGREDGCSSFEGDGGLATRACFGFARGVVVDPQDNVYITDEWSHRVLRVDSSTGIINTVAGNGEEGSAGDGGPATEARLSHPAGIAFGPEGNLYFADSRNGKIRRFGVTTGIITTVDFQCAIDECRIRGAPIAVAFGPGGDLHTTFGNWIGRIETATGVVVRVAGTGYLAGFTGDGGPATSALLGEPRGLVVDRAGGLYVADNYAHRIRRIDTTTGVVSTVAGSSARTPDLPGDGGPATEAALTHPKGVAIDAAGNLYISEYLRVRRVDADTGIITTAAGNGVAGFGGDGGLATEASLDGPSGLTLDPAGYLYIADTYNHRVRRVDAETGIITTVAGDGTDETSGDGGLATQASLGGPLGLAADADGNLYITDSHRIRRVDASKGIITTIAGNDGCAFGGDGVPATEACLGAYLDVNVDSEGHVYVSEFQGTDSRRHRIRRIDAVTGIITTVAGGGTGGLGDGGRAIEASLNAPSGIAFDTTGTMYIADSSNSRVRVVYPCLEVSTPALTNPSAGSAGLPLSTVLEWAPGQGAFRYDVVLDTESPPQRVVASDIETTFYSLSGLASLTTYYWKVVAKGDPFCDPFRIAESDASSFTTTSSCDVPGGFDGAKK